MAEEARRHQRIEYDRSMSFSLDHSDEVRAAKIVNISEGGLCLEMEDSVPQDAVMRMQISIPTFNGVISAKGVVQWCRPLGQSRPPQFHAGVSFISIPESQKTKLIDFLHRRISIFTLKKQEEEKEKEKSVPKTPRVMIIDDNADIRSVVANMLAPEFETMKANGGFEGVMQARDDPPDLILLDIKMPQFDGFDCLALLKDNPETKFIPVVMLTVVKEKDKVVTAMKGGAVGYVTKPFTQMTLIQKVRNVLSLQSSPPTAPRVGAD